MRSEIKYQDCKEIWDLRLNLSLWLRLSSLRKEAYKIIKNLKSLFLSLTKFSYTIFLSSLIKEIQENRPFSWFRISSLIFPPWSHDTLSGTIIYVKHETGDNIGKKGFWQTRIWFTFSSNLFKFIFKI